MEGKWFCTKCGQENDAMFCIRCGSPRPENIAVNRAAAPSQALNAAAPQAASNAVAPPAPKNRKKILIPIIIAAAVVLAAIIVLLVLFVFTRQKKTYENELGNYSIVVPSGYKTTEYDNGIIATKNDAALFVDYVESAPPNGALVYDWYDLLRYEFADRSGMVLEDALGLTDVEDEILDAETFGDENLYGYSISALSEDGEAATGEMYLCDSDTLGCYLICYYMKDDMSEKKAEKTAEDFAQFLYSFTVNGAPNIPQYEIADLSGMYLGEFAVRSELTSKIDVRSRSCEVISPDGNDNVFIEIIFANSIHEVFSWEGITDGQIESSSSERISDIGRYEYDVFRADYRDKNNNKRSYGIYGSFAGNDDPAIIAIEYNVSADNAEWAEEVVSDIMWSWYMY